MTSRCIAAWVLFAGFLPVAFPQSVQDFTGTWTVPIGAQTFAVLQVTASHGDIVAGTVSMPKNFNTDGLTISNVELPAVTRPINSTRIENHSLHILTHSSSDPSDKDELVLCLSGKDQGTLAIVGAPFDPWPAVRVQSPAAVSLSFDPGHTYFFLDSEQSSPEIQEIFEEDQRDRKGVVWTSAYGKSIAAKDAERRRQTRALLAANNLHSGSDFAQAAFIFQHGDTPQDFLLGHTLALAALARGKQSAAWIAAASLDRYLQSIGQPQIYGTRFNAEGADVTIKQPYDSTLITPSLRRQLALPPVDRAADVMRLATQP
jgi:hypothetical protein